MGALMSEDVQRGPNGDHQQGTLTKPDLIMHSPRKGILHPWRRISISTEAGQAHQVERFHPGNSKDGRKLLSLVRFRENDI